MVVGSSGGAVSAPALLQAHPEQVHTLVAHEPPVVELLEDRERLHAETADVVADHLAGDVRGAWRKFLDQAHITLPEPVFETMFGADRDPQVVADESFWFAHELIPTTRWCPDLAALRATNTRIVVGIGEDSTGQSCDHTSRALAAGLGIEPTMFPGDHTGFVGDPAAFVARLRAVLREG
ncbi:alpha/beta fold hydrolase [Embleya sp. NPDC020886]|uniref:alpha/beta fold hydrolase n=1 Tax=Embleya sp. NPDC020886 TaxID=3363980 RepID=UPI00378FFB58